MRPRSPGITLRAFTVERGWSLDVLAEKLGVSRRTLGRVIAGKLAPTAGLAMRIQLLTGGEVDSEGWR
jgi:plasmid maintenance system antidote protein VapI